MEYTYNNKKISSSHCYDIDICFSSGDADDENNIRLSSTDMECNQHIIVTFMIDKSNYWKQINCRNIVVNDEEAGRLLLEKLNKDCVENGIGVINKNKKIIYKI